MNQSPISRRRFLNTLCTTLAVATVPGQAHAVMATNQAIRSALKYQDKPLGDKSCSNCSQFLPGATAKDAGACKVIAGDREISPQGYCIAWVKK